LNEANQKYLLFTVKSKATENKGLGEERGREEIGFLKGREYTKKII